MRWSVSRTAPESLKVDVLVVGCPQGDDGPDVSVWKGLDRRLGGGLGALAAGRVFSGAAESLQALPGGRTTAPWALAMGLGKLEDLSLQGLRLAVAGAMKKAAGMEARRVGLALPWRLIKDLGAEALARSAAEGGELCFFDPGTHKARDAKKAKAPATVIVSAPTEPIAAALRRGLGEGVDLAAGCLLARGLVNMPPNQLTPARLASEARKLARAEGYRCTVHGEAALRKMGMGGILGVGQGSTKDSKLIVLELKPRGRAKVPTVALVGKGVTFDTGGISLKPGAGMHEMKADMGGAAAVLGAGLILARRKVKARLLVIVPTVENMPDGDAIRPGDVLKTASGKTVEVLNTDAEGRLILADALHHAGRLKADVIVDAATLTGACVVALGHHFAGLFTNDGVLGEALQQGGGDVFERAWPMPVVEEFAKAMESPIADLKNIGGGRWGGACTAAAFLEAFVDDDTPWAHLDIAGPAWTDSGDAMTPKGASGFGARLIARGVERYLEAAPRAKA